MPYIEPHLRDMLDSGDITPRDTRELTYCITMLILQYTKSFDKLRYRIINDVMGALEGAKVEYHRRVAVPYEEKNIKLNGDIYPEEE